MDNDLRKGKYVGVLTYAIPYLIKKGVSILVLDYFHNYTYKFLDSRPSLSERIANRSRNLLPIRVVMFNACRQVKPIPLEYILKRG